MNESSELALLQLVAQAADLCRKPLRHAVRVQGADPGTIGDCSDCCLLIEARNDRGERLLAHDLELEIYRSGSDLNLMLSAVADDQAPVLWHGNHPVWMTASTGQPCERPSGGGQLEALCRRLRALLVIERDPSGGDYI